MGPPKAVIPGVVPVELVLGRSDDTVVLLRGMRAFPSGLEMVLSVRLRGSVRDVDLHNDVFDGGTVHHSGPEWPEWNAGRLKWGFEFADGGRATNVDLAARQETPDVLGDDAGGHYGWPQNPSPPVLMGGGGGSAEREADREYWLWPLPSADPFRVVCQWPARGIEQSSQHIDIRPLVEAAERSRPLWND
jgi:hypothetical protein